MLPTTGERKPFAWLDRDSYRRDGYFTPDGQPFVLPAPVSGAGAEPITVIVNWSPGAKN